MLMQMAERRHGIEPMFDTFFGFLRRRTDYFTANDKAESTMMHAFNKHKALAEQEAAIKNKEALAKAKA